MGVRQEIIILLLLFSSPKKLLRPTRLNFLASFARSWLIFNSNYSSSFFLILSLSLHPLLCSPCASAAHRTVGYNGLPSIMSGLDDSLSDIAGKKKYPFELEKAIHNVMFIQHHMQRQDEFNAVSGIRFLASFMTCVAQTTLQFAHNCGGVIHCYLCEPIF